MNPAVNVSESGHSFHNQPNSRTSSSLGRERKKRVLSLSSYLLANRIGYTLSVQNIKNTFLIVSGTSPLNPIPLKTVCFSQLGYGDTIDKVL